MTEVPQQSQPDGALKAESEATAPAKTVSEQIPYARFKEVLDLKTAAEKKLADLERAARKAEEERLAAAQKFEELAQQRQLEIDRLKPQAERVAEMEQALKNTISARVARLPETARLLVPDYEDPRRTLEWLDMNEAILMKSPAPVTDAGVRGDTTPKPLQLTEAERAIKAAAGMTDDEWAKYSRQRAGP